MRMFNTYFIRFFALLIVLIIQLKGISILGTYWDDAGYIQTTPIIYDKIRIFHPVQQSLSWSL